MQKLLNKIILLQNVIKSGKGVNIMAHRPTARSNWRIRLAIMALPLLSIVLLTQTAFAKTTYVISDGNRVFTYESFATDPAEVLAEAGLELAEYDTFTTESDMDGTTLTVCRSVQVLVDYRGEEISLSSPGDWAQHCAAL